MAEYRSDNAFIAKDYPFAYVQPPRKYRLLTEDEIIAELNTYALSDLPDLTGVKRLDAISFQPSPSETFPNEDRLHVSSVSLPNHPRTQAGNLYIALDGHAGPDCVEYAIKDLPSLVIKHIEALPPASWSGPGSNTDPVCAALARAIQECDNNLRDDFMAALPPGEQLEEMSDSDIASLVKANGRVKMMARFQKGSTALAVLQVGRDVWTAGVGDCEAVVGTKQGERWTAQVISGPAHNLRTNAQEKQKLQRDHPGEEDIVVAKDRVLGLIAVSRALGDGVFKLPRPYLRVFLALPSRIQGKLLVLNETYKTPPYMSAIADTTYHRILDGPAFLIVTTDGLENPEYPYGTETGDAVLDPEHPHVQEEAWVAAVGKQIDEEHTGNFAVQLLRDLLGTDEAGIHRASAFVGLDHPEDHYQDDTSVVVAVLQ